jgi:hypothetical protein
MTLREYSCSFVATGFKIRRYPLLPPFPRPIPGFAVSVFIRVHPWPNWFRLCPRFSLFTIPSPHDTWLTAPPSAPWTADADEA